ncbi:hypothetical protein C5B96_10845 [Subtercola sp. Z020]|uniref:hypothetical protein n=1 Tax=Subtercola sp. Z020 TaxID=2080582 RepID=UPI000CE73B41|nr:hypothetical protein [Subtercola sp. Z020]PPF80583.1 hypothetical protein C5B96_10845 [Subtercola sp. Z020]
MADDDGKVPDARPGDAVPDAATEHGPSDDDGPSEADKRRRLIAARLVVAGVGLTFLIVGFVQFITK